MLFRSSLDHAILGPRLDCPAAFDWVRWLFREYRMRLLPFDMADAPTVTVNETPLAWYEAFCGPKATADTCTSGIFYEERK